jgi:hypothetical protein
MTRGEEFESLTNKGEPAQQTNMDLIEGVAELPHHLHLLPPWENRWKAKKNQPEPGLVQETQLQTPDADLIWRDA